MYRKTQSPLVTPLANKPLLSRQEFPMILKDLMKIGKIALMMDTSGVESMSLGFKLNVFCCPNCAIAMQDVKCRFTN